MNKWWRCKLCGNREFRSRQWWSASWRGAIEGIPCPKSANDEGGHDMREEA